MSTREKVCWMMDASEWNAVESDVLRKHGMKQPYLQIYVEIAMKEYLDRDRLVELEDRIEQLEETCPHSLPSFSRPIYSIPKDPDTRPVQIRIRSDLVDEFRAFVDEHTDYRNRYGIPLSKALNAYRTGGRVGRLEDRIQRLIDVETGDATDAYDPDADGIHYNDVDLTKLDGRTRTYQRYQVCQDLDPEGDLLMDDVRDAVRARGYDAPAEDDEFIRDVLDTLGYVKHPNNPSCGVVMAEQRAERIANKKDTDISPDLERIANIESSDFNDLSKPERYIKIRLAMAREVYRKGRKTYRFDYNFIRYRVFDDHQPSPAYANKAIEKVATDGGRDRDAADQGAD